MTLRRKPDTLVNLLPKLRDNPRYQGQEKLPVLVWVIAQVICKTSKLNVRLKVARLQCNIVVKLRRFLF